MTPMSVTNALLRLMDKKTPDGKTYREELADTIAADPRLVAMLRKRAGSPEADKLIALVDVKRATPNP